MTDKQKQAIMVINALFEHCGEKVFNYDDYFLLLDFIVGQSPIINMPFQREEPFKPMEVWYDSNKNYEPDGIFGPVTATTEPTMQGKSASSGLDPIRLDELREMQGGCESITESMKAKEDGMSYGDRLIKEGRSPL